MRSAVPWKATTVVGGGRRSHGRTMLSPATAATPLRRPSSSQTSAVAIAAP
ncbi:hypothetical protein ACFQ0B_48855 [Nonomuraea thailandensis]